MGTVEERVALIEGRVGEQSAIMEAIRQSVDRLDQRLTTLEARLDQRFAAIDQRFAGIDQRFIALDGHLVALRGEMSRQLRWIVSIQITVLLAITGAVLSAFFALR